MARAEGAAGRDRVHAMEREMALRERVYRAFCAPRESFATNDEVRARRGLFFLPRFPFADGCNAFPSSPIAPQWNDYSSSARTCATWSRASTKQRRRRD